MRRAVAGVGFLDFNLCGVGFLVCGAVVGLSDMGAKVGSKETVGRRVFEEKAAKISFVGFLVLVVGPKTVGLWVGLRPLGKDVGDLVMRTIVEVGFLVLSFTGVGLRVWGAVLGTTVGETVGETVGDSVGLIGIFDGLVVGATEGL